MENQGKPWENRQIQGEVGVFRDGKLLEEGDPAQPGMGQGKDWVYPAGIPRFPADPWMRGFSKHSSMELSGNSQNHGIAGVGKLLRDHGIQPFPALIHVPKGRIHRDLQSLWEWGLHPCPWTTLPMWEFSHYPKLSFRDGPNPWAKGREEIPEAPKPLRSARPSDHA